MCQGYLRICVDGRMYAAHRLAFLMMLERWPSMVIDHIDGDPSNNRWTNLRDVSRMVNQQNQRRAHRSNRSSGVLGVTWDRASRKWSVRIHHRGRNVHIGYFVELDAADAAYRQAKQRLHGAPIGIA